MASQCFLTRCNVVLFRSRIRNSKIVKMLQAVSSSAPPASTQRGLLLEKSVIKLLFCSFFNFSRVVHD